MSEREKWMPSEDEIYDAANSHNYSGGGEENAKAVEALIRRAARERAIEELRHLIEEVGAPLMGQEAVERIAALRAGGDSR